MHRESRFHGPSGPVTCLCFGIDASSFRSILKMRLDEFGFPIRRRETLLQPQSNARKFAAEFERIVVLPDACHDNRNGPGTARAKFDGLRRARPLAD
jgi:hypothetical protein